MLGPGVGLIPPGMAEQPGMEWDQAIQAGRADEVAEPMPRQDRGDLVAPRTARLPAVVSHPVSSKVCAPGQATIAV